MAIRILLLLSALIFEYHLIRTIDLNHNENITFEKIDTPRKLVIQEKLETNDKVIKLEKLIFHTTGCYGFCPTYHLQIDSNKYFKLFAEHVYLRTNKSEFKEDAEKTGHFIGILKERTFNKLVAQLESLDLDTLKFKDIFCCDGSIITLIVYYNGKRKFLSSMVPDKKAEELIDTLYDLCSTSKMQRTKEVFEIEGE